MRRSALARELHRFPLFTAIRNQRVVDFHEPGSAEHIRRAERTDGNATQYTT